MRLISIKARLVLVSSAMLMAPLCLDQTGAQAQSFFGLSSEQPRQASQTVNMKDSSQSQDAPKQQPKPNQQANQPNATPAVQANPTDVTTMDAIIAAVYDVISGPAGKKRDWNRMRSLFIPDARMIPIGHSQNREIISRTITVEDYIARSGPVLEGEGFVEKELARRVEQYGHIAHVFSTYEGRIGGSPQSQRFKEVQVIRGINSIQLMNDGKRWWVVTIFWDQETAETPIPEKYLKSSGQ